MKYGKILAGLCAGVLAWGGTVSKMTGMNFTLVACAAESGTLGENITWTLDDEGLLTISGKGEWTWKNLFPVESLSSIKNVVIENGITTIGDNAFYCCYELNSVIIPDSVTSIGDRAFEDCHSLSSISFPNSISHIGVHAFENSKWLWETAERNEFVIINHILIYYLSDNKDVIIPEGITEIADNAFYNTGLTSVVIPDSVLRIGRSVFLNCPNLSSVSIPNSVISIGAFAFDSTEWLETQRNKNPLVTVNNIIIDGKNAKGDIIIPDGIKCIGNGAFAYSSDLVSIVIPKSVIKIEEGAFQYSDVSSVTISDGVKIIENAAFSGCQNLSSFTLPYSIDQIDFSIFDASYSISSISILNPKCIIDDTRIFSHLMSNLHILRGYEGSTAQAYAEKWGYTFESLGAAPATEPHPDMDGDGIITASDAQIVLSAFAALITEVQPDLTPEQLAAADIDGSGEITALDAQYILTYYLNNTVLSTPTTWDEILHPNAE